MKCTNLDIFSDESAPVTTMGASSLTLPVLLALLGIFLTIIFSRGE